MEEDEASEECKGGDKITKTINNQKSIIKEFEITFLDTLNYIFIFFYPFHIYIYTHTHIYIYMTSSRFQRLILHFFWTRKYEFLATKVRTFSTKRVQISSTYVLV